MDLSIQLTKHNIRRFSLHITVRYYHRKYDTVNLNLCSGLLWNICSVLLLYPITLEGRRGTTDKFVTIPFYYVMFSAALVELAKSIPVHSLIFSSHLFFCLRPFLFSFTVPCRIKDGQTILASVSWPGTGVRHILQWLLRSFCKPPHL